MAKKKPRVTERDRKQTRHDREMVKTYQKMADSSSHPDEKKRWLKNRNQHAAALEVGVKYEEGVKQPTVSEWKKRKPKSKR